MKKKLLEAEYAALLRSDFHGFIERSFYQLNPVTDFKDNWHIGVLADRLEQVRLGNIKRLIINVPPRSLKSHCASVAFPAWLLGHNPSAQIICASYAQDLADKFASDCRTLMQSPMYKRIFNVRLSSQRPSLQELCTTRNGFRLATSVGGVVTGRGADFLIVDDPLKPDEALSDSARSKVNQWYDHTFFSRLNDKRNGGIVIIMQRLHEDDLVGHLLGKDDWTVVTFPAIADKKEIFTIRPLLGGELTYVRHEGDVLHPEREDRETLATIAMTIGSYNFNSQYQQSPASISGGMIKEAWFETYRPQDLWHRGDGWSYFSGFIVQSWDTANKVTELSDYSVCTTWGLRGRDCYLLDVYRDRVDYPTLKRLTVELARIWHTRVVLIEDMASGTQLIQDLIADGIHSIQRYKPRPGQDKIMRMHTCCSTIENGCVYLPERAEWLLAYKQELRAFPKSKHDDQVDSTSQALDWLKRRYESVPTVTFSKVCL